MFPRGDGTETDQEDNSDHPDFGRVSLFNTPGMSNVDHTIDEGMETHLKASPENRSEHSAWNFCGYVRFENGMFHERVYRFHALVGEYSANSLEELMEIVNNEHGYD